MQPQGRLAQLVQSTSFTPRGSGVRIPQRPPKKNPLLVGFFMGIFYKKMNKEGAITGMIVGISLMLFYILKFKFGIFDGGKAAVAGLKAYWWFGISPEGFGSIAMLVNFVVSFIVNRFTDAVPVEVQEIVENIRIPSGAGDASH